MDHATRLLEWNNTNICSNCGDEMDTKISNLQPTWSDIHDNIVCWDCSTHRFRATQEQSELYDDVCDYCSEQIGTITDDYGKIVKYIPYWVNEWGCICDSCYDELHRNKTTEGKQQ